MREKGLSKSSKSNEKKQSNNIYEEFGLRTSPNYAEIYKIQNWNKRGDVYKAESSGSVDSRILGT